MTTIHQMYCTHCTHGSSALQRREGDLAERTFGYSVRSGSLDGDQLQESYRQIEPLVYYHLPRDTPDEQKLRLCAASAPRRLFYVPSAGGLQLLGQVCYRTTDSEGRPGSYFAHLVFQDRQGDSSLWSPADALRLWGAAGWMTQDSPEIPFKLEPLGAIADVLSGAPTGIDDNVLASFLREPAESPEFIDPAEVVAERWRTMEPGQRRAWFLSIFSAFLHNATSDRQPLVIVAEPSVAAILFYGIFRMLPPGAMRDETGFSTFESEPDRSSSLLTATWPFDPQAAAQPDTSPWQRTTINTLAAPDSQAVPSKFAEAMMERFLLKGGPQLDSDLAAMATVQIGAEKDLDALVEIDRAVQELLASGAFPSAEWRNWPAGVEYLRRRLGERIAATENLEQGLKAILAGNAYLTVIDLLTAKPPVAGTRRAVVHLLKHLPAEKVLGLLKLAAVSSEDKVTALIRHIHTHGTLPPGCEFLWDEWAAASEQPTRGGVVLMNRVMAGLPPKTMERFAAHVPQRAVHGFLLNCLERVRQKKMKVANLSAMIRAASDEAVFNLVRTGGTEFLAGYPRNEPALGEKLLGMLRTLARHPDEFQTRLEFLLAGEHLLSDEAFREAVASWDKCAKKIVEVGRLQSADAGLPTEKRQPLLIAACRELAMAADRAMNAETMDSDYPWTQKRDFLLKIGQRVLGGTPLFVPGSWEAENLAKRVDSQFEHHRFPTDPLKKEASEKKKEAAKRAAAPPEKKLVTTSHWLAIGVFAALAAISVLAVWGVYLIFNHKASDTKPKKKSDPRGGRVRERINSTTYRDVQGNPYSRPAAVCLGDDGRPRGLSAAVVDHIPALVQEAVQRSG